MPFFKLTEENNLLYQKKHNKFKCAVAFRIPGNISYKESLFDYDPDKHFAWIANFDDPEEYKEIHFFIENKSDVEKIVSIARSIILFGNSRFKPSLFWFRDCYSYFGMGRTIDKWPTIEQKLLAIEDFS